MKIFRVLLLLALASTLTYCSKDDGPEEEMQQSDNPDGQDTGDGDSSDSSNQESTLLNADVVSDGLVIDQATKIGGNLPAANGAITLDLINTGSPLINEGFELEFNSNAEIAGMYLRTTATDGTPAGSYYDIPNSAFNGRQAITSGREHLNTSRRNDYEQFLKVGLDSTVPVGQFCYEICVYDAAGNISIAQSVCTTIESWGGNSALIGNWNFDLLTETEDGQTNSGGINDFICYTETVMCNSGGTVMGEECSAIELFDLTFNANGTFTFNFRSVDNSFDYNVALEDCIIQEGPTEIFSELATGNWAYNQTEGKLALVIYTSTGTEAGETYDETYPVGDGDLLFDSPISISGNTFNLTLEDGDDYTAVFRFKK